MEENQKKSFIVRVVSAIWDRLPEKAKNFKPIMRTLGSIALGGTLAIGGASIAEANSNDQIQAVSRNNQNVATDVVHQETNSPSALEKAVADAIRVSRATDTARDAVSSAINIGNSRNIESAVRSAINVYEKAQKSEKMASQVFTQATEKATTETDTKQQSKVENKQKAETQTQAKTETQSTSTAKTANETKVENKTNSETTSAKTNKDVKVETKETTQQNVDTKTVDTTKTTSTSSSLDAEIVNRLNADNEYFNSIKINHFDLEDDISNKRVSLNRAASQLKYQLNQMKLSGNYDTKKYEQIETQYKDTMTKYNELGAQLQEMVEKRRQDEQKVKDGVIEESEAFKPKVLKDAPENTSRELTTEKLQQLSEFRNFDSKIDPGVKIKILSDGLTEIKTAINGVYKNDSVAKAELVKLYNEVLVQRYELAKEALEHPTDSRYDLRAPIPKDAYTKNNEKENITNDVQPVSQDDKKENVSINDMNKTQGFEAALKEELEKQQNSATATTQYPTYQPKQETYQRKNIKNPEHYQKEEKQNKTDSEKVSINDMNNMNNFNSALQAEVAKTEKDDFNARIKVDVKNNQNKITFESTKQEDNINKYSKDDDLER